MRVVLMQNMDPTLKRIILFSLHIYVFVYFEPNMSDPAPRTQIQVCGGLSENGPHGLLYLSA